MAHAQQRAQLLVEVRTGGSRRDAEEVFQLADEDDQADAGREAHDHGIGNVLQDGAEASEAHADEHQAGEKGRHGQPADAVLCGNGREHRDKGAGGPGNLHARATEYRGGQSGGNRRVQALLRSRAGRDGKGHGQRHRDHADGQAGKQVRQPVGAAEETRAPRVEESNHAAAHGSRRRRRAGSAGRSPE